MIGTKTSDYTGEAAQRFEHYKLVRSEDGKPDFWAVDHKLFVLREGDIIVVWKPDRLARSTRDLLETMATIRLRRLTGVRYVITEKTVRGGEPVKQCMSQTAAPLSARVRWRVGVTRSS